ncbi:aluminum-activated malate transporter 10 [Phtheirospermum japonicum]|uniref:Aluminum-activated malate transporter 10 n=1 Tax=Phtheirospermum japonicum TaxID=374723 RepID=A0A830CXH3_9LAMI|nr:aluminum-activated malate transporter 10 [Phtheirospermum japonicum]
MAHASELCEGSEWRINFQDRTPKILVSAESAPQTGVCGALHKFVMGFLSNFLGFFREGWQLGKSEPKKLIHGFKVGMALSLVSLFYYMRPLYEGVGGNAMWAVLTVIAVFEYTVGATLIKCMNKATGTILAVALGICVYWTASQFRENFEPIILQGSICLISAAATFSRFIPSMKAHFEYGAIVFILTFTLISLSGYREEELFGMALHRLSTIAIGTSICILTSLLFCPVWAGNELHDLVKSNMEELAGSLDGSIAEYFKRDDSKSETSNSILPGYKSMLDSRATEESLASFAKWEPGHGGFEFRHPWTEYLKVGASLRSCAYCIEALNCTIDSNNTQAQDLEEKQFSKFCVKLSSDLSTVLKELVVILDTMTKSHKIDFNVLEMCNTAEQVQNAMKTYSRKPMAADSNKEETKASPIVIPVVEIIPLVTLSSLLIAIAGITEKMAKTINGFAHNA